MHIRVLFKQIPEPVVTPKDPYMFEDAEILEEEIFQDADEGTENSKKRKVHDRVLDRHLKMGTVIQHTYKKHTVSALYVGNNRVWWKDKAWSLSGFCRAHAVDMRDNHGYSCLSSMHLEFNGWAHCNIEGAKKGEWGGDIGTVKH
tara:strand:+ start:464 stop:898 length:435 start_codon:yes stop_codon:yes gene_type:complete